MLSVSSWPSVSSSCSLSLRRTRLKTRLLTLSEGSSGVRRGKLPRLQVSTIFIWGLDLCTHFDSKLQRPAKWLRGCLNGVQKQ